MGNFKKSIGNAIRELRKTRGLNQTQLALYTFDFENTKAGRKAGQTLISKFECGLQEPTVTEIYLILKVLRFDFEIFKSKAFKSHS